MLGADPLLHVLLLTECLVDDEVGPEYFRSCNWQRVVQFVEVRLLDTKAFFVRVFFFNSSCACFGLHFEHGGPFCLRSGLL